MDTTQTLTVLVRDRERFVQLDCVEEWDWRTILASVSSDPRDFHELGLAWSRYRPDQALVELPWEPTDGRTPKGDWLLMDLACQRIVASCDEIVPAERCTYQRDDGEWSPDIPLVWFNFAPWWQRATAATLERQLPAIPPPVESLLFREVLFGRTMAQAIADRILAMARTESLPAEYVSLEDLPWDESVSDEIHAMASRWSELTKRVHADWLMSPCDELDGRTPRSFLHAGRTWVEWEIENRSREWSSFKRPPRALDRETQAYRHGPMGLDEVVIYFDFCRKVIPHGWRLVLEGQQQREPLAEAIFAYGQEWLNNGSIDDDRSSPRSIMESSRRHMPRLVDGTHLDCDCPLCRMMADESSAFSPMFTGFDGHHLELEDEFAFSLHETEEEWREQQAEFDAMKADFDKTWSSGEEAAADEPDEFASAWKSSYVADEATMPGLGISTLTLGCRLTEIISDLRSRPGTRDRVKKLNTLFDAIRAAETDGELRKRATDAMISELEDVAVAHSFMTSKIADLESQLDAWSRRPR